MREPFERASEEPLDVIIANEADGDTLTGMRVRALWNEIVRLNALVEAYAADLKEAT